MWFPGTTFDASRHYNVVRFSRKRLGARRLVTRYKNLRAFCEVDWHMSWIGVHHTAHTREVVDMLKTSFKNKFLEKLCSKASDHGLQQIERCARKLLLPVVLECAWRWWFVDGQKVVVLPIHSGTPFRPNLVSATPCCSFVLSHKRGCIMHETRARLLYAHECHFR